MCSGGMSERLAKVLPFLGYEFVGDRSKGHGSGGIICGGGLRYIHLFDFDPFNISHCINRKMKKKDNGKVCLLKAITSLQ